MTDNEIIKALECCISNKCTCSECSYEYTKHIKNEEFEVMSSGKSYDEWSCDEWLKCDLLDLINRYKAEMDRLADRNHKCIYLSDEETTEYCVDGPCPKFKTEGQIRAEAVKEFAERLTEKLEAEAQFVYDTADGFSRDFYEILETHIVIDNLVKEFTEATDD